MNLDKLTLENYPMFYEATYIPKKRYMFDVEKYCFDCGERFRTVAGLAVHIGKMGEHDEINR